jgi:hypothetical protein
VLTVAVNRLLELRFGLVNAFIAVVVVVARVSQRSAARQQPDSQSGNKQNAPATLQHLFLLNNGVRASQPARGSLSVHADLVLYKNTGAPDPLRNSFTIVLLMRPTERRVPISLRPGNAGYELDRKVELIRNKSRVCCGALRCRRWFGFWGVAMAEGEGFELLAPIYST